MSSYSVVSHLTLPNLLSVSRIGLSPWIGWMLSQGRYLESFPWIVVIGLTDFLDGYLARRWNQQSAVGEVLDPIGDKVAAGTGYAALTWSGLVPAWMFFLVVGRDLLILLFGVWAFRFAGIRRLPPTMWGKISTFCQFFFVLHRILDKVSPTLAVFPDRFLLALAAGLTVWSGVHYGWVALRLIRPRR